MLKQLGHVDVNFGQILKSGKISITFTHQACGTTQTWQASNITKVLKKNPHVAPCSKCGAKRRTSVATLAYMKKYGIDEARADEWEIYRKLVRRLTGQTYRRHKELINPLNLKRGMFEHHLDHKFPIIEGFLAGLEPAELAKASNLQMLTSTANLSKGRQIRT